MTVREVDSYILGFGSTGLLDKMCDNRQIFSDHNGIDPISDKKLILSFYSMDEITLRQTIIPSRLCEHLDGAS